MIYCIDVLTQISAVQAARDLVALGLLDDRARECVIGADDDTQAERTDEMMATPDAPRRTPTKRGTP